jgi:WD40 repeat protein
MLVTRDFWSGRLHLWDLAKREKRKSWENLDNRERFSGTFSPDGQTFASPWINRNSGKNFSVDLIAVDSGRVRSTFDSPLAGILGVRFREEGQVIRLVASTPPRHQVVDVDVATGRILSSRLLSLTSATDFLGTSALSSDGRLLVVCGAVTPDPPGKPTIATLWDLDRDQEAFRLPGQPGASPLATASFSIDDKLLALGFNDGGIEIWDLTTRHLRMSARAHSTGFGVDKSGMVFSPDGSILASGGSMNRLVLSFDLVDAIADQLSENRAGEGQSELVLIDTSDGRRLRTAKNYGGVEFSPDGRNVATSHEDGMIRVHEAPTSR